MHFDLVDLRLFLHIAEARSITHGAQRSNLALASASGRIRGMVEACGGPLLTRDRRGVSLTAAGQSLVEHARLITQLVERMRSDLGGFVRGLSGGVEVLSNTAAFSEYLSRVLGKFLTANPTIDLSLVDHLRIAAS